MIEGIEIFYQRIAKSINEWIPEPWSNASVDAIFYPQHIAFTGEYMPVGGVGPKSIPLGKGTWTFYELREAFKKSEKPLWCRAHFEINSNGKFKMTWGYDDCDKDGFAKFDEEAEAARMEALKKRMK